MNLIRTIWILIFGLIQSAKAIAEEPVFIKPLVCHSLLLQARKSFSTPSMESKSTFQAILDLQELQEGKFPLKEGFQDLPSIKIPSKSNIPKGIGLEEHRQLRNVHLNGIRQRINGILSHYHMSRKPGQDEEVKVVGQRFLGESNIVSFLESIQSLHETAESHQSILKFRDLFLHFLKKNFKNLEQIIDDDFGLFSDGVIRDFEDEKRLQNAAKEDPIIEMTDAKDYVKDCLTFAGAEQLCSDYALPRTSIYNKNPDRPYTEIEIATDKATLNHQFYEKILSRSFVMMMSFFRLVSMTGSNSLFRKSFWSIYKELVRKSPVLTDWFFYWNEKENQPELLVFFRHFRKVPEFPKPKDAKKEKEILPVALRPIEVPQR